MDVKSKISFEEIDSFHALCSFCENAGYMRVLNRYGIFTHKEFDEYIRNKINDMDKIEDVYEYLFKMHWLFGGDYYLLKEGYDLDCLDDIDLNEVCFGETVKSAVKEAITERYVAERRKSNENYI